MPPKTQTQKKGKNSQENDAEEIIPIRRSRRQGKKREREEQVASSEEQKEQESARKKTRTVPHKVSKRKATAAKKKETSKKVISKKSKKNKPASAAKNTVQVICTDEEDEIQPNKVDSKKNIREIKRSKEDEDEDYEPTLDESVQDPNQDIKRQEISEDEIIPIPNKKNQSENSSKTDKIQKRPSSDSKSKKAVSKSAFQRVTSLTSSDEPIIIPETENTSTGFFKEYKPLIAYCKKGCNRLLSSDRDLLLQKGRELISENCIHFMATYAIRSSVNQISEDVYWLYDQEYLRLILESITFSGNIESLVPNKKMWIEMFSADVVFIPVNYEQHWSILLIRGLHQFRLRKGRKSARKKVQLIHCDSLDRSSHSKSVLMRVLKWIGAGIVKIEVGNREPITNQTEPIQENYQMLVENSNYTRLDCCSGGQKPGEMTCGWFTVLNALRVLRYEISQETPKIKGDTYDKSVYSFMQWIEGCIQLAPNGTQLPFHSSGGAPPQQVVVRGYDISRILAWMRTSMDSCLVHYKKPLPTRYASPDRIRDVNSNSFRSERNSLNNLNKEEIKSISKRVVFITDERRYKLLDSLLQPAMSIAFFMAEFRYSSQVLFAMNRFPSSLFLKNGIRNVFLNQQKLYGALIPDKEWKDRFNSIFSMLDVSCVNSQRNVFCFSPIARSFMQEIAMYMLGLFEHIATCFLYAKLYREESEDLFTSFVKSLTPNTTARGKQLFFNPSVTLDVLYKNNACLLQNPHNLFDLKNSFDLALSSVQKVVDKAIYHIMREKNLSPFKISNGEQQVDESVLESCPDVFVNSFLKQCMSMIEGVGIGLSSENNELFSLLASCTAFLVVQYNSKRRNPPIVVTDDVLSNKSKEIEERIPNLFQEWKLEKLQQTSNVGQPTIVSPQGDENMESSSTHVHGLSSQQLFVRNIHERAKSILGTLPFSSLREQSAFGSRQMFSIQIFYLLQPYLSLFHLRSTSNHSSNSRCQLLSGIHEKFRSDISTFQSGNLTGYMQFPIGVEKYQLQSMRNVLLKTLMNIIQNENLFCVDDEVDEKGTEITISQMGDPRNLNLSGKVIQICSVDDISFKDCEVWNGEQSRSAIGVLSYSNTFQRTFPSAISVTLRFENEALSYQEFSNDGRSLQFKAMDIVKLNINLNENVWGMFLSDPTAVKMQSNSRRKSCLFEADILIAATQKEKENILQEIRCINEDSASFFYQPAEVNLLQQSLSYASLRNLHNCPSFITNIILDPVRYAVTQFSLYQSIIKYICRIREYISRTEANLKSICFYTVAEEIWKLSETSVKIEEETMDFNLNQEQRHVLTSIFLIPHIQKNMTNLNINSIDNFLTSRFLDVDKPFWASQCFFIQGPPGTGKTRVLSTTISLAIKLKMSVLMLSTTNNAVDSLMSIVISGHKFGGKNHPFVRLGSNSKRMDIRKLELAEISRTSKFSQEEIISRSLVTFSTYGAAMKFKNWSQVSEFQLIIIDEAAHEQESVTISTLSQIMSSTVPLPRAPGCLHGPSILYVGDPQQQEPYRHRDWKRYSSMEDDNLFFKRVVTDLSELDLCTLASDSTTIDNNVSRIKRVMPTTLTQLNTQYRMNKPISDIVSTLFYQNKLNFGGKSNDRKWVSDGIEQIINESPLSKSQVSLIDCSQLESPIVSEKIGTSWKNNTECDIVENIVSTMHGERENVGNSIGILSPYSAQVREIYMRMSAIKCSSDVRTIDSCQGMEFDIVIISLVRGMEKKNSTTAASFEFLDNPNFINVALSRARERLIIVAATKEISERCETWKRVFELIRSTSTDSSETQVFSPVRTGLNTFQYNIL